MVSREEAVAKVDEHINEPDLDWPTKPKQVVFDDLIEESDEGWLIYYGIPDDLRVPGRDPEPKDNPPCFVDRATGELRQRG